MVWESLLHLSLRCVQYCVRGREWLGRGLLTMEDIVSKFASKFAITEDEQKLVVVDRDKALALRSSRGFLMGEVLTSKPLNKENFKRHMRSLWRPKANVLIVKLKADIFAFGFNTKQERTMIHRGGPWLYNKQSLLVLEEADDIAHPTRMKLSFQEFWIQIKGLPLCYMTRQMGKLIGNILVSMF